MHIVKQLLEGGHSVRVISRSQEKGQALRSSFPQYDVSKIEIAIVEDQLANNAYDEAAKGVDFIIRTASPFIMTAKDVKKGIIGSNN
jgi:nucleoside-diphosphate-sugar epimerase